MRAEEGLRQMEFEAKVQQVMQVQQAQREATSALPFIAALDVNNADYDQQALQVIQRAPSLLQDPRTKAILDFQERSRMAGARRLIPQIAALDPSAEDYRRRLGEITQTNPAIYEQPATRDILRDQSYEARRSAMPQRSSSLVEKALSQYPHLAQAYDDEVATLGEDKAARNLYWATHDADLENQLAEYGFDLPGAKPEDLARLRLPDGKHYDPVRVTAWIKQNGSKKLEALTPEARDKELKDLSELYGELSMGTDEQRPLIMERIQTKRTRLGLSTEATPPPAASTTAAAPSPIEPTPENWTQAKRVALGLLAQASGGDPTRLQQLLVSPALRRAAVGDAARKVAVGKHTYGDVAEGLTAEDLAYFRVPLQNPVTPGQMRGGPAASRDLPSGFVRRN